MKTKKKYLSNFSEAKLKNYLNIPLYSRIGFARKFNDLSEGGTRHILKYEWKDLS